MERPCFDKKYHACCSFHTFNKIDSYQQIGFHISAPLSYLSFLFGVCNFLYVTLFSFLSSLFVFFLFLCIHPSIHPSIYLSLSLHSFIHPDLRENNLLHDSKTDNSYGKGVNANDRAVQVYAEKTRGMRGYYSVKKDSNHEYDSDEYKGR